MPHDVRQGARLALYAATGFRCVWCGAYAMNRLSIDHMAPKGTLERHRQDFMVPACSSCNEARGKPETPFRVGLSLDRKWGLEASKTKAYAAMRKAADWRNRRTSTEVENLFKPHSCGCPAALCIEVGRCPENIGEIVDILTAVGTGTVNYINSFSNDNGYKTYFISIELVLPGFKPGSEYKQFLTLVCNEFHGKQLRAGNTVQFSGRPKAAKIVKQKDGSFPAYGKILIDVDYIRVMDSSVEEPTFNQEPTQSAVNTETDEIPF